MQDEASKKENSWLADRSAGILILLLSLGTAAFTIISPLIKMLNHMEDVLYSTSTIALNVMGILFGLANLILGGENLNKLLNPSDSKGTTRLIIFTAAFFGLVFGSIFGWNSLASAMGY
jgi:hypothetical protein